MIILLPSMSTDKFSLLNNVCCEVAKLPFTSNEGRLKAQESNQNSNSSRRKPKALSQ
jgi:hypothetical protein